MSGRKRYFNVVEGRKPSKMPFVPDITDWYNGNHTPPGKPRKHGPAVYIPDEDPIRDYNGTMERRFWGWSLMDFYRNYNWGFHAHIYDWVELEYGGEIEHKFEYGNDYYKEIYVTKKGSLERVYKLAKDGTWCPKEYFVKKPEDLEVMSYILENEKYVLKDEYINWIIDSISEMGVADLNIKRSPFGKLIHEILGFENTTYALSDYPESINQYLKLQKVKDMEVIDLACKSKAKFVMISDHADENLISPYWYEKFCIPFYNEANEILHEHNKITSTHLDGNFKGFFNLLDQTEFDVLDGCTPYPMFNYKIEELADALPENMYAFVGVPSALFCDRQVSTDTILSFGERIKESFAGRAILNVGDILPPNGDIDKVIALGRYQSNNA